jgi:predicted transcriptional regulator
MARSSSGLLTGRESEIMGVIWRLGEATADQVRAEMNGEPHDSTVRTLLRVLETKGHLTHETRGKAFVYRAAVARVHAQKTALSDVLARFFGGSAEALVMSLIEDEHLTPSQLDDLRSGASEAPAPSVQAPRKPRRGRRRDEGQSHGHEQGA